MSDTTPSKPAPRQYRLVAIDLDGTLLGPDGRVSERTKSAVHKALGAGLLICFATGRNYTESQFVLDAVGHYGSAVFVGGAMVVDTKNRVTLHRTRMQPDLARDLSAEFERLGHVVLALQDTGELVGNVDYLMTAGRQLNHATEVWVKVTEAKVHFVPELGKHPHEHTIRVGIVAESGQVREVQRMMDQKFAGRIVSHAIYVPAYGVEVLEAFDPAVNKWEGILHVARQHDIDPATIIAIGDDVNDIPMLKQAGLGVAMGNATPPAKAAARMTIKPNSEDGLAQFLEQLAETNGVV